MSIIFYNPIWGLDQFSWLTGLHWPGKFESGAYFLGLQVIKISKYSAFDFNGTEKSCIKLQ